MQNGSLSSSLNSVNDDTTSSSGTADLLCNKCQKRTIAYKRSYSGESLCSSCFSDSIVKKTAKTISKYNMISPGDTVGVAVSGGKDSLSLLHVLYRISTEYKRSFNIKAITVDEGIPTYRDEALELVRQFCQNLGVEYGVYPYKELFGMTIDESLKDRDRAAKTDQDNSKSSYPTSCSFCGTLRRRALDIGAKDFGVDSVATAHNLDDSLQTFLINMMHGDTPKIGWMHPDTSDKASTDGFGSVEFAKQDIKDQVLDAQEDHNSNNPPRKIKPFCEIYENEIVFYAFTNSIPFQSEECPHMNEGIRTQVRKFLNTLEKEHSGIKNSMYHSAIKISQTIKDAQLNNDNNNSKTKSRQLCAVCGNPSTGRVCSVCSSLQQIMSWKEQ